MDVQRPIRPDAHSINHNRRGRPASPSVVFEGNPVEWLVIVNASTKSQAL